MRQILFVVLFFRFAWIYSQDPKPGGVHGSIAWKITEAYTTQEGRWKSNTAEDTSSMFISGKLTSINSNPAIAFNTRNKNTNISMNLGNLEAFSLFTVCQESDSLAEQVIFSLENDSLTETVLTNFRMAALDEFRYYNYIFDRKLYPKIYSYTQNQKDSAGGQSNKLILGRPPQRDELPVSVYKGFVPEVIVFNRSISPYERRRVESYLALKYGISLRQDFPTSYLNSEGKVIWDAEINAGYNKHIAGIGRDDVSGLKQYHSESSESPGILQISTTEVPDNNSFLIWGDNNGPLRFEESPGIRKFQRQWKASAFRNNSIVYQLRSNELAFSEIEPLHEGETFWLMIDKSGTGKFPFGQTEYIKTQSMVTHDKSILFDPVIMDSDSSGHDVFTLLIAPPFFTRSCMLASNCFDINSGTIQTEIVGGSGPYKLTLLGETDGDFKKFVVEPGENHLFKGISQGKYTLHVTDAKNNTFIEEILVSNAHPWELALQSRYSIASGEILHLDASAGMPRVDYFYSWTTPDGHLIHSEEIAVSQPGNYILQVSDENNCNSMHEIVVIQAEKSIFRKTQLFPNPAKGWFVLRIELESKADVQIRITDLKGNLLISDSMLNEPYYLYTNSIEQEGIYAITLISGNETETIKLVVN